MSSNVVYNVWSDGDNFRRAVWPIVAEWFGGGSVLPVDAVATPEFAETLSREAGIVAWQINGRGMRGIAYRVDYGPSHPRFGVLYERTPSVETELEKHLRALTDAGEGYIVSQYSVQAYFDTHSAARPSYVCATRTRDLLDYVTHNYAEVDMDEAPDGTEILIPQVFRLKMSGYHVWEWDPIVYDAVQCPRCGVDNPGDPCHTCRHPQS